MQSKAYFHYTLSACYFTEHIFVFDKRCSLQEAIFPCWVELPMMSKLTFIFKVEEFPFNVKLLAGNMETVPQKCQSLTRYGLFMASL